MDLSAERSTAADFQQPEKVTPVRRKLVQSTLFPTSKKRRLFDDENCKIDEAGEEALKSCTDDKSVKKNSKRDLSKPKDTSRASKQIVVNGKETPKETENGCFPDTEKSDITPKKKIEEESTCISPEIEKSCLSPTSPISTPQTKQRRKRRTKCESSPKDRNLPKLALFKKSPLKFVLDEPKLPVVIPDLRSEAKLSAEENSRLFAGKPVHPFFSSCKAIKRNQEISELDSSPCSLESQEGVLPVRPIHVLQAEEGDAVSLDWGKWEFSEGVCMSTHSGLGSDCSSFVERCVSSLQIDDFTTSFCPIETSTCQNEDKEDDGIGSTQTFFSRMNSAAEFQRKFLPKGSYTQVENSLWTDKYQPRYASQICGNSESVKFLNEWLYYWHKKKFQTSFDDENSTSLDADNDYGMSGTDSESCDDETSVKNVLLITGPVGSGKSAAIYACAQEQGFQIIEVNASDWRTGALVKQRFREALESHRHNNTPNSKKSPAKSLFGNNVAAEGFEEEVEMVKLSNEENSQPCSTPEKVNGYLTDDIEIKTLILFEDIDATLSEDHGFLSTVQRLALTAKRPMILTSNDDGSVLPKNLERLTVPFEIPSMNEVLGLGRVVCDAENANIHPCLLDRCVENFQGDIRKTIFHLQFWCQGLNLKKGAASGITYRPLHFDLDAGHHILPKLISLSFPSPLSEYVENEITKSLKSVEKLEIKNGSVTDDDKFNRLQTKKKAMLNLNSFYGEELLLAQPGSISECSDTYSSPVTFAKSNGRRIIRAIMSSDSDDQAREKVPVEANGLSVSTETLLEEQKSGKRCKTTSILDHCNSANVSVVPESVLFPVTVSYNPICFNDPDSINSFSPEFDSALKTMIVGELVRTSQIEHEDNVVSAYQTFDESTRCDPVNLRNATENSGFVSGCNVEETWRRLRECHGDLQQYVTPEYKDSLQAMNLSFNMSNLISEYDLLHNHSQPDADDTYVSSSRWPDEMMHSYRWYDDHAEMSSVVGQHGLCSYAKEADALMATVGSSSVNLAWEMLSSSTNPMALRKLLCLNKVKIENSETMAQLKSNLEQRKTRDSLRSLCRSVVSPKAYLGLERNDAFYEYLSTLTHISRFETTRLSQQPVVMEKKRRRSRGSQHYLSSGSWMLSPQDILMLNNCMKKSATQYRDS